MRNFPAAAWAELGHERRAPVNRGDAMTATQIHDVEARLESVRREIARACADARRDPEGVTLVAVSKTFAVDAITPVLATGQKVFGENRVQEAMAKWPVLR